MGPFNARLKHTIIFLHKMAIYIVLLKGTICMLYVIFFFFFRSVLNLVNCSGVTGQSVLVSNVNLTNCPKILLAKFGWKEYNFHEDQFLKKKVIPVICSDLYEPLSTLAPRMCQAFHPQQQSCLWGNVLFCDPFFAKEKTGWTSDL